jgi:hypothetical protein
MLIISLFIIGGTLKSMGYSSYRSPLLNELIVIQQRSYSTHLFKGMKPPNMLKLKKEKRIGWIYRIAFMKLYFIEVVLLHLLITKLLIKTLGIPQRLFDINYYKGILYCKSAKLTCYQKQLITRANLGFSALDNF